MKVVTHEDYLAAIAVAVCEQYPATASALSEVRLVFGSGVRRRGVTTLHREWGGVAAEAALPLVEIAAVGGLTPAETCHVVLHELAHVLAPGEGHGRAWRHAARQVGLMQPRAWPDTGELADWTAIAPIIRTKLQAIPEPTEPASADYGYDWQRRPCGAGYGTRGGMSRGEGAGSRYLKVVCQHPGCGYQVRGGRPPSGAPWYAGRGMSLRDRWQPDGAARRLRAVGRAIAWIRVGYILAAAGLIYACAGRRYLTSTGHSAALLAHGAHRPPRE